MPLVLDNITKTFEVSGNALFGKKGLVHALTGFKVTLQDGESLGIVGESGSGKTTLAKILAGFHEADQGTAELNNTNLLTLNARERAPLVQMVFQDPFASLNPKLFLGIQLFEALRVRGEQNLEARAEQALKDVGLPPHTLKRYPHQLSGGQRQRFAIARALAAEPSLLLADEPVSSLDLSIQAQIINLLNDLRKNKKFSLLVISHDLAVIANLCQHVVVMKEGNVVEAGPIDQILTKPTSPYTKKLLKAAPIL